MRVAILPRALLLASLAIGSACGGDDPPAGTDQPPDAAEPPSTTASEAAPTGFESSGCEFPQGFYNRLRADQLEVHPDTDAFVAGLSARHDWPKGWEASGEAPLLRPMADNGQVDFADGERQQNGLPVDVLPPDHAEVLVRPHDLSARYDELWRAGQVATLGAVGHSVEGPYPAIGGLRYQGFPVGPRWDSFSVSVGPDCTVYEMSGLKRGAVDPGYLDPPFGVFAAMTWEPGFTQTAAQTAGRTDDGFDRPLGATAAYVPLVAGVVRLEEVQEGQEVDHVVHMFSNGCTDSPVWWPARASDCGSNPGLAPYGTVFRLRDDFDAAAAGIDDPAAQKVVEGLRRHGMMLLSTGGDTAILMESAACPTPESTPARTTPQCWGTETLADVDRIPLDAFEAVDTSALRACHPERFDLDDDWWTQCSPSPGS